jgi:acyl-CoA reductase-like NAD-dependent aldehyde dehydrogenase
MRSAILQLPDARTANERRQVLRAAIRQLERAEIYLAAVAYMELEDRASQRAVQKLRSDVDSLRRHLGEERNRISD